MGALPLAEPFAAVNACDSRMIDTLLSLPARAVRALILLYRVTFSAIAGRSCRYAPTCSEYADEAIASLRQRAIGKPTQIAAALAIEARIPTLDLWPLEDFLIDSLEDADPRLSELAYAFGRRQAARENTGSTGAFNFGFGQRVASVAWRRLHPAQLPPRDLASRPTPAQNAFSRLRLPLPNAVCEKELPKLAARISEPSR